MSVDPCSGRGLDLHRGSELGRVLSFSANSVHCADGAIADHSFARPSATGASRSPVHGSPGIDVIWCCGQKKPPPADHAAKSGFGLADNQSPWLRLRVDDWYYLDGISTGPTTSNLSWKQQTTIGQVLCYDRLVPETAAVSFVCGAHWK